MIAAFAHQAPSVATAIQYVFAKLLLLSALSFSVFWCAHNYKIDLTRSGDQLVVAQEHPVSADEPTACRIRVRRVEQCDRDQLIRTSLREPLPDVTIPLRVLEPDGVLQLQPLIDGCYRDGRYHRINYALDPIPRLDEENASWADRMLRDAGRR